MAREIDSTRNEKLPRYDLRFMDNHFAERMRRKKQDPFKHRQRRYHKTGDFVVEDIEVPMAVQCSRPFREYRSDKMEPVFRGDDDDDKYDNGSDTEYDENGFPKFGSLRMKMIFGPARRFRRMEEPQNTRWIWTQKFQNHQTRRRRDRGK